MRIYFLFCLFIVFAISNGQQVPNSGFENWTNPKTPDNWFSGSSISVISNLCKQNVTDKIEGIGSAELNTKSLNGLGATTYEFISLGSGDFTISKGFTFKPIAFAFRPDSIQFYYKYESPGTDTAQVKIKFTKGGKVLLEQEKSLVINDKWDLFSMLLTNLYSTNETPDSLLIQFYSSKPRSGFFGIPGSVLKLDKVHMGYNSVNVAASAVKITTAQVFPNPSNLQFKVKVSAPSTRLTLTVYSLTGAIMITQPLNKLIHEFDVSHWKNGVYYYRISENDQSISNGIIHVNHNSNP